MTKPPTKQVTKTRNYHIHFNTDSPAIQQIEELLEHYGQHGHATKQRIFEIAISTLYAVTFSPLTKGDTQP